MKQYVQITAWRGPVECARAVTLVARELLKGEGGDKLGGVGGHDHLYIGVLLHQRRDQRRRFVGGNAAGDPKQNGFSL